VRAVLLFLASCGGQVPQVTDDAAPDAMSGDAAVDVTVEAMCPTPSSDPVLATYKAVDDTRLVAHLKDGSGVTAVSVGDAGTQMITNRYSPSAKELFRSYIEQYYTSIGVAWTEMPYPTLHSIGEMYGHNIEAVLPGASKDSIVVIVHYDSIGPPAFPTTNPGADDDLTGVVSLLEAARLFSAPCVTRAKTIRLVLTDYEEQLNPGLEGARIYAKWLKNKAMTDGFQIVAAIDYEQSGWNCASDGVCAADVGGKVYDVFDCSGDPNNFKSTALGDAMQALTMKLGSPLTVHRACMAQNSDHYAMWEIGVPSVVTSEHLPLSNPHFDYKGGDTFDKLDLVFHAEISRLSIAYTAQLAGVGF